jgi:hypothetical protein
MMILWPDRPIIETGNLHTLGTQVIGGVQYHYATLIEPKSGNIVKVMFTEAERETILDAWRFRI